MVFGKIGEAFSLSHAQVLDGTKSFVEGLAAAYDEGLDIYGVNESSLEPDTDSYDNEGDDAVLSTWAWLNKAALTVQAGYFSFPLLETIYGRPVLTETDEVSTKTTYSVDLWHEDSMNIKPLPMIVRMPAKDAAGNPADFVIGLYRVSFDPMTFAGPAYKDGLKTNYNGNALWSNTDEKGVAFTDGKKRIGRLLFIER